MEFLENLYRQCIAYGFGALSQEALFSAEAGGFTLAKEENTTLCLVQVADLNRLSSDVLLFLRTKELERAAALNPMYSSIWVVFLTIEAGTTGASSLNAMESAEAYYGQSPYAIYWHVDTRTGKITVCADQPNEVMGLKMAVNASFEDMLMSSAATPPHDPSSQAQPSLYKPSPQGQPSPREPSPQGQSSSHEPSSQIQPPSHEPPSHEAPTLKASSAIITTVIATVNIIVMLLMYVSGFDAAPVPVAVSFGAIVPSLIWGAGEYYRLFTAMFIHFGWMHLFFNVAGIFIFGTRIEQYYGKGAFMAIYFFSGLIASVTSLLFTQGISAGASGAVYGLLGAAFIYTRCTKRSMDIISNQVILVYIVMGIGMGFIVPGIDYFGHIGGLFSGMLIGYIALRVIN